MFRGCACEVGKHEPRLATTSFSHTTSAVLHLCSREKNNKMAQDLTSTSAGRDSDYLRRAYALDGAPAAQELYDQWANAYDNDLNAMDYQSPQRAVEAVLRHLNHDNDKEVTILDAGCGTGMVGTCFASSSLQSRFVIDGLDLSEGMLAVSRKKNVYRHLDVANLDEPLKQQEGAYNVVTCVGTLTKGHVGPKVFREFVRVTARGGLVVATVHNDVWVSGGYEKEVEDLRAAAVVDVLSTDEFGIVQDSTTGGRMVVLQKR